MSVHIIFVMIIRGKREFLCFVEMTITEIENHLYNINFCIS